MFENIVANDGITTALSGMGIVFGALILIASVIHLFNKVMADKTDIKNKKEEKNGDAPELAFMKVEDIPEDELAAITAAIEFYRRLHFEPLQSEITFKQGEPAVSGWKTGYKFGQRAFVPSR